MNTSPAGDSGPVWPSTRRLLSTFFGLLASLAVVLGGAGLLGVRLRPPLERVSVATYAARRGIALPSAPIAPQLATRGIPAPSVRKATPRATAESDTEAMPRPALPTATVGYHR